MCHDPFPSIVSSPHLPEGWVRERVVGKIAGVVVGSGSCLEAHWRHRRHAELFPRVVWPETAEVIFLDTACGDHMWNWTLKTVRNRIRKALTCTSQHISSRNKCIPLPPFYHSKVHSKFNSKEGSFPIKSWNHYLFR